MEGGWREDEEKQFTVWMCIIVVEEEKQEVQMEFTGGAAVEGGEIKGRPCQGRKQGGNEKGMRT